MAVRKLVSTSTLQIEVATKKDSNGKTVYSKKSFQNLRTNADLQDVFDVASAIEEVINAETRDFLISENAKLIVEG